MFNHFNVTDMKGVQIRCGQRVVVHTDDGSHTAEVNDDLLDPTPTKIKPGFWVDVDDGNGLCGQPSYILEVINE